MRHRASGEVFAVKRSRRRFRSKLQRERCLREIRAVAALPAHPNIVNQYRAWQVRRSCCGHRTCTGWLCMCSVCTAGQPSTLLTCAYHLLSLQEGGHFYIQMDFCEGGTLGQCAHKVGGAALRQACSRLAFVCLVWRCATLHASNQSCTTLPQACATGTCMPDEALWAVACQAAQGLAFLHSHGVMHLDVKPDNIYLSAAGLPQGGSGSSSGTPCCAGCSSGTWRIGDFGLAVARGQDGSMVRGHGRVA